MTTKELFKERMMIRKTDPVRASVIGMLVDAVQKATRELDREDTQADIEKAAKKMYDQTLNTIAEYKKGNNDTSSLEAELAILEGFLPETMSPEKMEEEVKKAIESLPVDQRVLKNIMPKIKDIPGIDMKLAKGIVEKLLK